MVRPAALFALLAALLAGCTADPAEPTDAGDDTDSGTDDDTDTDTTDTDLDTAVDTGTDTGEEPIVPGSETVSATWDVDLFTLYESPTLARFDTLDGRRKLDRMTIAVDHGVSMTVFVENEGDVALGADDFSHEFYFQTLVQLGVEEGTPPGDGPPFFGPGSFLAVSSADLAAKDDVAGSGPDFHAETVEDTFVFEARYDEGEARYLEAMTGTGELQLVVGGFTESFVYWADDEDGGGVVNAGASALQYAGTITVTYHYSPAEG